MEVKVGYITSWRRAIFFALVIGIVLFGTASTLAKNLLGAGILSNMVSVGSLLLVLVGFCLVLADYFSLFEGNATVDFSDEGFSFRDRKRAFSVSKIEKLDIEPIYLGQQKSSPLAYRVLIQSGKKKIYIESERAKGLQYNEVDLYRLYVRLQQMRG